ncbi:DUF3572 family protein [Sphingomonas mesophila]|uniref:DUF3572 family protein n=1 Tax=Sphingomonas mesophila TaxID=2303576 RepID=UPI000E582581|nr:DUF3572 family protein [Sphingomonas mesophila]
MQPELPSDRQALALNVLAATLTDERRAARFLDLTGLSPEGIRERVDDPVLLAAVVTFLEAHEPDLISVAAALGCDPAIITALGPELER